MTKKEIINQIAVKTGIKQDDVKTAIESFFEVVKDNMANGHNVYVRVSVLSLIRKDQGRSQETYLRMYH